MGNPLAVPPPNSRSTPRASPVPSNRSGGTEEEEDSPGMQMKAKIFPQVSPGTQLQKYQCPLCHEQLACLKDFTAHIRGHNEVKPSPDPNDPTGQAKVYHCCLCGKMLSSFSSLDRHMLVHSGERPFACVYCGQTFTTNGNMHRHKRTHGQHRDSKESDTSSGGSSGNGVAKQQRSGGGGGRKRKGSIENQAQQHAADFLRNSPTSLPFDLNKAAASAADLNGGLSAAKRMMPDQREVLKMQMAAMAMAASGANVPGGVPQGKPCPVCKENFFGELALDSHIMAAHPGDEIQCEECPVRSTYSLLKLHKSIYHHKSFASFPTLSALNAMSSFAAATNSIVKAADPPTPKKADPPPPPMKVKDDPILDLSPNKVIPVSHSPTPVLSALSPAPFSPKTSSVKTPDQQSLAGEEEKTDECEGLLREMKLKGEFPCRICPAVYPNLRALKGHNKEHMNKAPYECNVANCLYSSSDKCTLARHMRQHTGEKPFECKECNFGFTTKANCERHVKNKHGKSSRTDIREAIVTHEVDECDRMDTSMDDSNAGSPVKMPRSVAAEDDSSKRQKASLFAPYSASLYRQVVNEEANKSPDAASTSDGGSDAPLDLSRPILVENAKIRAQGKENYESLALRKEMLKQPQPPIGLSPSGTPSGLNPFAAAAAAASGQMPFPFLLQHLASSSATPATNGASPFEPTAYLLAYQDLMRRQALQQQQSTAAKDPASFLMHLSNLQSNLSSASVAAAAAASLNQQSPLAKESGVVSPNILKESSISSTSPSPLPTEKAEQVAPSLDDPESDYKMVIKNGVLMRKQKQKRYRTEKPHQCDYCDGRFTLRSNMDRHVKQQHPEHWAKFKAASGLLGVTEGEEDGEEMEEEEEGEKIDVTSEERAEETETKEQQINAENHQAMETESSDEEKGYLDNEDEEFASCGSGSEDGDLKSRKQQSAYSAAPNRIPCPHCPRTFPWSSSLERHILTHTGEKPYKCDECPLWFTTKSNCDRHLLRKHGNNNLNKDPSEASEVPEKVPQVPERPFKCPLCPSSTFSSEKKLRKHHHNKHVMGGSGDSDEGELNVVDNDDGNKEAASEVKANSSSTTSSPNSVGSENPFKCHLCDDGFPDRKEALEHLRSAHSKQFEGWLARGAFDVAPIDEAAMQPQNGLGGQQANPQASPCENGGAAAAEDGCFDQIRGKFPDYANRKIVCLFCLRKFWSAEDLRRHVRSHTGDRPYECDICHRRFSLKHSMLRHRKKHDSGVSSCEGDDDTDDDCSVSHSSNSPGENHATSTITQPPQQQVTTLKKRANLMETINKLSGAASSSKE